MQQLAEFAFNHEAVYPAAKYMDKDLRHLTTNIWFDVAELGTCPLQNPQVAATWCLIRRKRGYTLKIFCNNGTGKLMVVAIRKKQFKKFMKCIVAKYDTLSGVTARTFIRASHYAVPTKFNTGIQGLQYACVMSTGVGHDMYDFCVSRKKHITIIKFNEGFEKFVKKLRGFELYRFALCVLCA
jgi:hypothetical protein